MRIGMALSGGPCDVMGIQGSRKSQAEFLTALLGRVAFDSHDPLADAMFMACQFRKKTLLSVHSHRLGVAVE